MNSVSSPFDWNEDIVASYLEEAASIHRRLPEPRIQGYFTLWPEPLKDDWRRLYDMVHGRFCLGSPMPPEVTFHEEVMEWLRLLDRHRQQVVWMRANRIPWKILTEEFGQSRQTLFVRRRNAVREIALHLNRADPTGEHFRRLRGRANSVVGHG